MMKNVNQNWQQSSGLQLSKQLFIVDSVSSSLNSTIAFSSSIDFPNNDKTYHLRAVGSHLILSSSAGSVVTISSSLNFPAVKSQYHITATSSSLILSASTGYVVLSSSLIIGADRDVPVNTAPGGVVSSLKVHRVNSRWGVVIEGSGTTQSDLLLYVSGGTANARILQHLLISDGTYTIRSRNDALSSGNNYLIGVASTGYTTIGDMIQFRKNDPTSSDNMILATSNHLNLSCSSGHIRIRPSSTGGVFMGRGSANPSSSALLELSGTNVAFIVTRMTTSDRDALSAVDGMIIYNSTLGVFQGRAGGAWVSL
jgi:hypothetical protein